MTGVRVAVGLTLVLVAILATGCSSGTTTAAKPPSGLSADCEQAGAVLADGPDPGADPVGYAESQILPLGQIHATDPALHSALAALIAADRALVAANGSGSGTGAITTGAARTAASKAVAQADKALDAVCPGVSS